LPEVVKSLEEIRESMPVSTQVPETLSLAKATQFSPASAQQMLELAQTLSEVLSKLPQSFASLEEQLKGSGEGQKLVGRAGKASDVADGD
jgi:hypothetical protein